MSAALTFIVGFLVFAIVVVVVHGYVAVKTRMERAEEIANLWFISLILGVVLLAMIGLTVYTYG